MKECRKFEQYKEKYFTGELKDSEKEILSSHLSDCDSCRGELSEIDEVINMTESRESREPDSEFMENFWEKLEPQLDPPSKPNMLDQLTEKVRNAFSIGFSYKYQLAAGFSILLIGIFIGRFFLPEEGGSFNAPGINVQKKHTLSNALQIKTENYIERSKILLLGLMNFDPASDDVETISLQRQKSISRELLTDATLIKAELENSAQVRLKELVGDLEVILLQIANLESEYDLTGIELVKNGVDKRGIFLKINVREMEMSKASTVQSSKKESGKRI